MDYLLRGVVVTSASFRNLGLLGDGESHWSEQPWWPEFNLSDPGSVSIGEYREWYSHYGSLVGPNITECNLEKEMNKVIQIKRNTRLHVDSRVTRSIFFSLFNNSWLKKHFPLLHTIKVTGLW